MDNLLDVITFAEGQTALNKAQKKSCSPYIPHLSKGPSDLKQNGTQENMSFSGPAFHRISCGVICFDLSVSTRNHPDLPLESRCFGYY